MTYSVTQETNTYYSLFYNKGEIRGSMSFDYAVGCVVHVIRPLHLYAKKGSRTYWPKILFAEIGKIIGRRRST